MRRVRIVAAAAAVMAATASMAGCGGGSAKPAATATTVAAEGATLTTMAGATTASTFTGKGSAEFCGLAKTYQDRITGLATRLSDPTQLKPFLDELSKAVKQAVDVAPAEIKADVKVLADAATSYVDAFAKAGYDYTKLSPDAPQKLATPEVQAAAARLSAYSKNVCGSTG